MKRDRTGMHTVLPTALAAWAALVVHAAACAPRPGTPAATPSPAAGPSETASPGVPRTAATSPPPGSAGAAAGGAAGGVIDERFRARLLEIGAAYRTWPVLTTEIQWAPMLCILVPPEVVSAGISGAPSASLHGRKLYRLFAQGCDDYVAHPSPSPVGRALVKESFAPEIVAAADAEPPHPRAGKGGPPLVSKVCSPLAATPAEGAGAATGLPRPATKAWTKTVMGDDGVRYRAGDPSGLFVMYKLDPATPGTDAGWVYGTLTADGRTVTSAGVVESCAGCHARAPHDHLFGSTYTARAPAAVR